MRTENGRIKSFCWAKHLRKRLGLRRQCSKLRRASAKLEIKEQRQ